MDVDDLNRIYAEDRIVERFNDERRQKGQVDVALDNEPHWGRLIPERFWGLKTNKSKCASAQLPLKMKTHKIIVNRTIWEMPGNNEGKSIADSDDLNERLADIDPDEEGNRRISSGDDDEDAEGEDEDEDEDGEGDEDDEEGDKDDDEGDEDDEEGDEDDEESEEEDEDDEESDEDDEEGDDANDDSEGEGRRRKLTEGGLRRK